TEIIDKDGPGAGKINRRKLGSLVFGETPQCRAGLEMLQSTIHPLTRQSMIRQISAAAAEAAGGDSSVRGQISVILDVPLLFESQWDLACDTIWCITAPLNARQAWAAKRGWTAAHLKDREQKQISTREKQRRSTITIANDSTPAALRSAVLTELRKIVATSTDAFFTL
ncbi:MAG: dephospho-CoA kinase, partial [Planctomycetota bacterium]